MERFQKTLTHFGKILIDNWDKRTQMFELVQFMYMRRQKMIKIIERFLAWALMVCLFLILIISAVEIAAYSDWGYYEDEFEKHHVITDSGLMNIEMDELIEVTKQMMSYLRGDREDLVIYAEIDGEVTEYFDERDKSHMVDVRNVFVTALDVRAGAFVMAIIIFANLCLLLNFDAVKKLLFKAYLWTIGYLSLFIAAIAVWAVVDFTGVFYKFHALFFSNYEWILDPEVSRLINMVPEGFFVDIAIRIVVIFIMLILIMGGVLLFLIKAIPRNRVKNTSVPQ